MALETNYYDVRTLDQVRERMVKEWTKNLDPDQRLLEEENQMMIVWFYPFYEGSKTHNLQAVFYLKALELKGLAYLDTNNKISFLDSSGMLYERWIMKGLLRSTKSKLINILQAVPPCMVNW